jgi:hypothetical protein
MENSVRDEGGIPEMFEIVFQPSTLFLDGTPLFLSLPQTFARLFANSGRSFGAPRSGGTYILESNKQQSRPGFVAREESNT